MLVLSKLNPLLWLLSPNLFMQDRSSQILSDDAEASPEVCQQQTTTKLPALQLVLFSQSSLLLA